MRDLIINKSGEEAYDFFKNFVDVESDRTFVVSTTNVFNVLNYQEATTVDMNYERSGPGDINPDFGKALTFQAPRQLQFAARYEF